MKQPLDEERLAYNRAQTVRQSMSDHTLAALGAAYAKHLMERTGITAEELRDRYFQETGDVAEGNWHRWRKWAGAKVYILDQLHLDPFPEEAA